MLGIINPCLAYEVNLLCFLKFTEEEKMISESVAKREEQQSGFLNSLLSGFGKGKFKNR